VELPLQVFDGNRLRLALQLPVAVDENRVQDRKQPRFAVRSGPKVVERPVRTQVGFLGQIARVFLAAREVSRRVQDVLHQRKRRFFETRALLAGGERITLGHLGRSEAERV
jgi:hypothetical protein